MNKAAGSPASGRIALPDELGLCFVERRQIEPGLAVAHSEYRPLRALRERSAHAGGQRTLVITLALHGESGYVADDDARLAFRGGYTTVSSFHGSSGVRHYAAGAQAAQLRLLVEEEQLRRYVGEQRAELLLPRHGVRQLGYAPTSQTALAHSAALLRCLREGEANDDGGDALALHIHTLSLLAEQLQSLPRLQERRQPRTSGALSEDDVGRLHHVRALMAQHMAQPLTIAWLCREAGLSEFKLKLGCRRLFACTPHQLLLELRMRHAHALLAAGKQVAQAAWATGYRHPANFSAAFMRYYGHTPKAVRPRR